MQPRPMCFSSDYTTSIDSFGKFQLDRTATNQILREPIHTAQNKYKQYAHTKRIEANFQVGDWVFLRLQPYRQISVVVRRYLKLAHKYFGPYKVIEKIGQVAYKLQLPTTSQVHPVFHISLLKKKLGPNSVATTTLPRLGQDSQFVVYPARVLQRRTVKRNNAAVVQWLIQWTHSIPEDATWEDSAHIRNQYPDFNFDA